MNSMPVIPTAPLGLEDPARRAMLKAAAGGAILLGFHLPLGRVARAAAGSAARFEPNAFIRIDRQGQVTLIMPQVEMGQGIYTGVAMILAEELDAPFERVVLEAAPPNDKLYANPALGLQATGGSTSVRAFWTPLRKAGAGARAVLIQAAATVGSKAKEKLRTLHQHQDSSSTFANSIKLILVCGSIEVASW